MSNKHESYWEIVHQLCKNAPNMPFDAASYLFANPNWEMSTISVRPFPYRSPTTCVVFASFVARNAKDSSDCPFLEMENRIRLSAYMDLFQLDI